MHDVGYIENRTFKARDDETISRDGQTSTFAPLVAPAFARTRHTDPEEPPHSSQKKVHHASLIIDASSSALEPTSASRRRRDHSRPSLPNASAFHIAPTTRHANPRYVHVRKIHPTTLRHRASACSHPSRYIRDPRVHAPSSCNTCRNGSAHSSPTLAHTSALGPYRFHHPPRRDRARRDVTIATQPLANRFTPNDASCENRRAPALAAPPASDAASNGQHHDPTSAGALASTAHATAIAPPRERRAPIVSSARALVASDSPHPSHRSRSDPYDALGDALRERSSKGSVAAARIAARVARASIDAADAVARGRLGRVEIARDVTSRRPSRANERRRRGERVRAVLRGARRGDARGRRARRAVF